MALSLARPVRVVSHASRRPQHVQRLRGDERMRSRGVPVARRQKEDPMALSIVSSDPLCSTRWLRPFVQAMQERHLEVDRELAHSGLSLARLTESDTWLPRATVVELLERVGRTADPALGIHAANCIKQGEFDVLEYAASTCATLGEAIECAGRYLHLMDAGASVSIVVEGERAALCYDCGGLEMASAATEFMLATLLLIGRRATGMFLQPLEVHFRHSAPRDRSAHEALFAAPLTFNAKRDAIYMPAFALQMPLTRPEPALHSILERHANTLLDRVPRRRTFKQRVLELIAEELTHGNPGVDNLANRLHVSPRTFLRRLKREGTTHRELVTEVRRKLALRYLEEGEQTLAEVSYLLGFSSSNAFHKAFRQWMGTTPNEYRRSAMRPLILARAG